VAARRTQTPRGRLIDVALWTSTAALAFVTLMYSFAGSFPLADKFGHGLMYFATFFCFLLAAVWRPGRGDGPFPKKGLVFAFSVVAAGVAVELLQGFATTNRHAELGDMIAEVVGAFGALAILAWGCGARGARPPV
jgi:hypothetical protein